MAKKPFLEYNILDYLKEIIGKAVEEAISKIDAISSTEKGRPNGVATLDSNGKVPTTQLPSDLKEVFEYDTKSSFPSVGKIETVYIDKATNTTYRWDSSLNDYKSIGVALGETEGTAYAGNKGKQNADNIEILKESIIDYNLDDTGKGITIEGGFSGGSISTEVKNYDISSDYLSYGRLMIADDGHIVSMFMYFTLSQNVPDGTVFATIPNEYKPYVNTYFNINGDNIKANHCYIDTDGNIKPWQNGGILKTGNLTATITYIKYGTISNIISKDNLLNYSTEVQDTGKKWIDGEKVYQVSFHYKGNNDALSILGVLPIGSDIIDMRGSVKTINPNGTESSVYPLTYADGEYYKMIRYIPESGQIQLWNNYAWVGWQVEVILTIEFV